MSPDKPKGKHVRQGVYFSLLSLCLFSQIPSSLLAHPCVFRNQEDIERQKTATIAAGATVIALIGGIACAAFASGHGHHSHHSSSSDDSLDPLGDDSHHSHSHHSSHRHSDHHSYHHSHSHFSSESSSISLGSDPQFFPTDKMPRLRLRPSPSLRNEKEACQLSGIFLSHPSLSSGSQGSFTIFAQLPDGTTETVGRLSFSGHGGSSLSFGPFSRKGSYTFGLSIDQGSVLLKQTHIGSIEIKINGSTVQSKEFFVPADATAGYEPPPFCYDLL